MLKRVLIVMSIFAVFVAAGIFIFKERPPTIEKEIAKIKSEKPSQETGEIALKCPAQYKSDCEPTEHDYPLLRQANCDRDVPKENCLIDHYLRHGEPAKMKIGMFWEFMNFREQALYFATPAQLEAFLDFNDRIPDGMDLENSDNSRYANAYVDYGPSHFVEGQKMLTKILLQFALGRLDEGFETFDKIQQKNYPIRHSHNYPQAVAFRAMVFAEKSEAALAILEKTGKISFKQPAGKPVEIVGFTPVSSNSPKQEEPFTALIKGFIAKGDMPSAKKALDIVKGGNIFAAEPEITRGAEIFDYYSKNTEQKPQKSHYDIGIYLRPDYAATGAETYIRVCVNHLRTNVLNPDISHLALRCIDDYLKASANEQSGFFMVHEAGLQTPENYRP